MANRKAATAELLKWIEKLIPGSANPDAYAKSLAKLSDAQFGEYMQKLADGEEILSLIAPNLEDKKLTMENNLAIAKELGHSFFERLWLTDSTTGEQYLTPIQYMVVDLPLRRQQQTLLKKIKIPEDTRHIDELSGQPTGPSKGARISFPELQALNAQGFDKAIEEMIKYRGGDEKGFQAMTRQVIATGGVSINALARTPTKVTSTRTLSTFLTGMHLKNNL
jgi:hypothetical protein